MPIVPNNVHIVPNTFQTLKVNLFSTGVPDTLANTSLEGPKKPQMLVQSIFVYWVLYDTIDYAFHAVNGTSWGHKTLFRVLFPHRAPQTSTGSSGRQQPRIYQQTWGTLCLILAQRYKVSSLYICGTPCVLL